MVRIDCALSPEQSIKDGILASAYQNPIDKSQFVIFTNLSAKDVLVDFGKGQSMKTYITSRDHDLYFTIQDSSILLLQARSVSTVIIDN